MPSAGAVIAFDPTNVQNQADIKPMHTLGAEFTHVNGNTYRYVRHNNGVSVASAAGGAAYWHTQASGIVTSDKTNSEFGAAVGAGVAGIYQNVCPNLYYTWIVTKGPYVVMIDPADAGAVGAKVFAPVTDINLTLRSEADATLAAAEISATEVGRQIAAVVANTALVMLNIA